MSSFRAAALAILLFTSQCMAQPVTRKVQPDLIDFGTFYTGAIVEGKEICSGRRTVGCGGEFIHEGPH